MITVPPLFIRFWPVSWQTSVATGIACFLTLSARAIFAQAPQVDYVPQCGVHGMNQVPVFTYPGPSMPSPTGMSPQDTLIQTQSTTGQMIEDARRYSSHLNHSSGCPAAEQRGNGLRFQAQQRAFLQAQWLQARQRAQWCQWQQLHRNSPNVRYQRNLWRAQQNLWRAAQRQVYRGW